MTNVCLGILARNEAAGIAKLIADLGEQSLLLADSFDITIIVVANGCTDDTAKVAKTAFEAGPFARNAVTTAVRDVARPGKSNAWNLLVHEFAPQESDFILFLDGDIRIPKKDTLELVIRKLTESPHAVVAVDRSVKDLSLERPVGIKERLIRAGTGTATDTRTAIAGALYCVRASELHDIWLPLGLPGEDGFLRAMLLTSSFSRQEDLSRIVYVGNAFHVFDSLRTVSDLVAHNVRLAIGTAINILLFHHLREIQAQGQRPGEYIRQRNEADSNWVNELLRERLKSHYFPLEGRFLLRRLRRARRAPVRRLPKLLPIVVLGTAFDVVVYLKATGLMRRGAGAGFW